jgi:hypothetical protein
MFVIYIYIYIFVCVCVCVCVCKIIEECKITKNNTQYRLDYYHRLDRYVCIHIYIPFLITFSLVTNHRNLSDCNLFGRFATNFDFEWKKSTTELNCMQFLEN